MNIRPKPAREPLGKTLAMVGQTRPAYAEFGAEVWSEDGAIDASLKELVFLRTSIVNQCPT